VLRNEMAESKSLQVTEIVSRSPSLIARVLEFVLERSAFYSPFAAAMVLYEKPVFHS
jgi:hypothetical protein